MKPKVFNFNTIMIIFYVSHGERTYGLTVKLCIMGSVFF